MQITYDLYYSEKKSPCNAARPDAQLLTDEYRVLHNVSQEEVEQFIKAFSHARSAWRVERKSNSAYTTSWQVN